jgi:predicted glycosyltransferase
VVIELFPFGRKKFAAELVPLLERARQPGGGRPLVACSLRDILVSRGDRQRAHDERAALLVNRLFDLVLVHSDPSFARLEESFRPATPLRVPIHHTGFVAPTPRATEGARRSERLVVSAGGGRVGAPLLEAAMDAHELLARARPMRLIAGPLLPQEDWAPLAARARHLERLELVRSVPGLGPELRAAAGSVSQCGYNTALELLRSGVPALVVPFAEAGEDEQTRRARRLEALGAVRVLEPGRLTAGRIATELRALAGFVPRPVRLDTDGAACSAASLHRRVEQRQAA